MTETYRIEHDSMGEIRVPADHLWGAQTERSRQNFPIGLERHRWGREVIRALGTLKAAAALANAELGALPAPLADAIARAAREVADGLHDAEFPLSVFQTGSGTQTNMNANEVIAHLAGRLAGAPVHPNDHVNRSQSSNDAFPTVMHLASLRALRTRLLPALHGLCHVLRAKSAEFSGIVMIGRTHLQDATPITLGQVMSGWVAQLDAAGAGIAATLPGLLELAIGGTAVGTGLNAPPGFGAACAAHLARETGEAFTPAANHFAALSAHDAIVAASAALRTLAGALLKIANDVRWYASGPRAGIGELRIPENEPGSSIMPGKVNPTQCEALTMVCVQVFGNDAAVAFAGSQGNFQLNVFKPVMLSNMLDSAGLLADAITGFTLHCASGIEPEPDRIRQHLDASLMLVTALAPHIGYERAASIARAAHREKLTLREVALREITAEAFDGWVRAEEMTKQKKEVLF